MDSSAETNVRHRKMVPKARDVANDSVPMLNLNDKTWSGAETSDSNVMSMQTTRLTEPVRRAANGGYQPRLDDDTGEDARVETSITQPLLAVSDSDDDCGGDDVIVVNTAEPKHPVELEEAWWQISIQVFFPYLVAGFGMVAAGLVLDVVQVSERD